MDATITNASGSAVFVPGPNLNLAPSESKVWPNITVTDLDGNTRLRELVVAGTLTVSVAVGPNDAAVATQGSLVDNALPLYTVAALPTGFAGRMAFATNGRIGAEGGGVGTGCPVVFSNAQWRRLEDMATVAA